MLFITLGLTLAAAGCAEATAEVNTPPPPPDPQLVRGAERVLKTAPTPEPNWRVGVVVTESNTSEYDGWSISVITADSVEVLTGRWCENFPKGTPEEREPYSPKVLSVLLDPGDLITWTGDAELCHSEVRVLRKAAAAPEPSP